MLYQSQCKYIREHPEQYAAYARKRYHKLKEDPEAFANYKTKGKAWREANKESIREKQKLHKRERKLEAIKYLGGVCKKCRNEFHPAVYEFHHRNPEEKDRDPSKLLQLRWEKVTEELDKCDLLCANCHRLEHHNWN